MSENEYLAVLIAIDVRIETLRTYIAACKKKGALTVGDENEINDAQDELYCLETARRKVK